MSKHVYYIPHGGGPLPLLGDHQHKSLVTLIRSLEEPTCGCRAIIVVTAHWESEVVQISGAQMPSMLFDYYGFPPESYTYKYPAPGSPEIAHQASILLDAAGIENQIDTDRGFDHGTFVPMMLMRPKADIPVVQLSLMASLDPEAHIAVGRALSPLLEQNVAIVGSGLSFHNLGAILGGKPMPGSEDQEFDSWLNGSLVGPNLSQAQQTERLVNWSDAPGARFCHPREEHLLPLHVCYGAASAAGLVGENIFRENLMGFMTSGFRWSTQATV